ncbi:MAG: 8-oxo-dGTP diphosphatase [Candidatus Muirbacterium halophilum]|nr:8-oxo-dGTP diphosphatase [Candidatus Muirbacterium halophilum]MCK9475754.1 8-oxo-dGTP diphosphatase [Candidatus Muirbacterium halophilum]
MQLGVLGYIIKDNKVLLLYRNKKQNDMHEGKWVAPGGHIEHNETPYEALLREIKEETGLNVLKASLKIMLTFPEDGTTPFGELWYGFVYLIEEFNGELIKCNEGELSWIELDNIYNLPMWEGDKIFTPYVFKKGIYDIKLVYSNLELIDHSINKVNNY